MLIQSVSAAASFAEGKGSADWQARFEEVSRPAANAMELSVTQLEALLAQCEALKGTMAPLDESARKVFGKRLQMTCDLYRFMLESRKAAAEDGRAK